MLTKNLNFLRGAEFLADKIAQHATDRLAVGGGQLTDAPGDLVRKDYDKLAVNAGAERVFGAREYGYAVRVKIDGHQWFLVAGVWLRVKKKEATAGDSDRG